MPQHTENGFGTYEWDPERGVVFRMDLDQFGTVGGVPISQYTPPPLAAVRTAQHLLNRSHARAPAPTPWVLGRTVFRSNRLARVQ
ncbi:hypothetical protein [Rhodococcus jostii]|uniref:Uncharacterized protein n=1 Tax=Rhodococcus jostii TaxID=132919 RepID=A0ABU4CSR1_RHOJO|nr:hypothetical protein [Rhodococcus jostii]MDV6286611.1 hypothetical protein [Rhodococcus jostii]